MKKKFVTIGLDPDIAFLFKLINAKDKNFIINDSLAKAFIAKENELLAGLEDKVSANNTAFTETMSILKERYLPKENAGKIKEKTDKKITKKQNVEAKIVEEIEEDDFD